MKTAALFISLLVFSSQSFARLSDGKAHVNLKGTKIVTTVDAGFHFNKDAPASLVFGSNTLEPEKKEAKEFVFDAAKVKANVLAVNFYVCDDKNTVCESHEEKYQIENGKLVTPGAATAVASATATVAATAAEPLIKNHHGFYQDNLEGALKLAAKENKLVLVDFNAPWCPSCIRLETEAFGEAVFAKATKKLIKVSINIDKQTLKEVSKKYNVKAIPTLIVMNSKGEELARLLDFRPAQALAKDLNAIQSKQKFTQAELQKKAEAGDIKARETLAEMALATMKYDDVVKWLTPLNKNSLLLANGEVRAAEDKYDDDKKTAKAYQGALEKWIAIYPQSIEAIEWRPELMKLLKGESKEASSAVKAIGAQNITVIDNLLTSEKAMKAALAEYRYGDLTGIEKMELLSQKTETYKIMDDTKNSEATAALLAQEVKATPLSEKRPGQVLSTLQYMKTANMKAETKEWLEKLAKTYPDTDVYYRKLANFHVREKQYDQALPYAEKAAAVASDMKLYNLKILAEIHQNLKQKKEAIAVVDQALALPDAKWESNKATVTGLQDIKKAL